MAKTNHPLTPSKLTGLAGVLMLISTCALANLTVYPISKDIGAEQTATTLQVFSKSPQTQYVRVNVKRILNPATPLEKEVEAESQQGLVVSPDKFVLPAGATRTVRLITLVTPLREEAWRVYFEPVASLGDEDPDKSQKAQVNVNLVWGVLIRLLPAVAQPLLARSADGAQLLNQGNVRLGVLKVGLCSPVCRWQQIDRSVYPGEALMLPAGMSGGVVRVEYRDSAATPVTADLPAGASTTKTMK
ncbi:putative fimbrial protein TcfA [Serratia quinivorans]|uniref:Putative fimbrial protein TcfA n=2 Tax=Serratia TaxID=613 RepID=A0A379ZD53_9GAMM|nr:fimbrial protein [Serratia proteamaculans]CAI1978987.1 putative fimbrial protein TcfA [Serratia quinivorans]SUI59660.1 putative fimbrial protein TcfA [Serratia quinivorans]